MRRLFLDDFRDPPDVSWDVVRNYDEFVTYIGQYGVPDMLSFDHDLAEEHYRIWPRHEDDEYPPNESFVERTGLDCAQYLVDHKLPIHWWQVHSANPVGAKRIRDLLTTAYYEQAQPH